MWMSEMFVKHVHSCSLSWVFFAILFHPYVCNQMHIFHTNEFLVFFSGKRRRERKEISTLINCHYTLHADISTIKSLSLIVIYFSTVGNFEHSWCTNRVICMIKWMYIGNPLIMFFIWWWWSAWIIGICECAFNEDCEQKKYWIACEMWELIRFHYQRVNGIFASSCYFLVFVNIMCERIMHENGSFGNFRIYKHTEQFFMMFWDAMGRKINFANFNLFEALNYLI